MDEFKHRYFICYQALSNKVLKTSNSQIKLMKPIRNEKDIELIIDLLKKDNPDSQLSILSIYKFENEEDE